MKKILTALLLIASLVLTQSVQAVTNSHSTDLERTSTQYWSITDASQTGLDTTGNFTVMTQLKPESQPSSGQPQGIYAKYRGATGERAIWWYYQNPSGTANFSINLSSDGNTVVTKTINSTLSNATQYQVSLVYTAARGGAEIFVDGASIGTVTGLPTSIVNSPAEVRVGNSPDADGFTWDGLIDDTMVFNAALTEANIDAYIADPCNWTPPASLQARWLFNNDGVDETANNNDLTNNNTATFSTDVAYSCAAVGGDTPPSQDIIYFD